MMKKSILAACAAAAVSAVFGAEETPLSVVADLLQIDPGTKSLVASGNVTAVHRPYRMTSAAVSRDAAGVYRLENPTTFTTCTNETGCLHWRIKGGFQFADGEYASVEDATVSLFGVPVFWIPWLRFPLWSEEGLRVMPGYVGRWGAYLMTKYVYHLAGSRVSEDPDGWGLDANTRFDWRYRQGVGFGQSFKWRLGEFGQGEVKGYYAFDRSGQYDFMSMPGGASSYAFWGSDVPDDRYALELKHDWEITERDRLRVAGAVFSDSFFREDFFRNSLFMLRNQWLGYDANEAAWEHNETWAGAGISVSGPLNDFIAGTTRLPEAYFDVTPLPVFGLPFNYESSSRAGFLRRRPAYLGVGSTVTAYNRNPGPWAEYETGRFDTYHRLTAPMRIADVVSVVPRLAYRGTLWGEAGAACPTGWEDTHGVSRNVYRSILEGGITFDARGTADYDGWRHTVEPYLDVLAQKAWYPRLGQGARPYVFDAVDASLDWSEQFDSRGHSLPYTWCGFTPGVRNVFDTVDEKGRRRRVLDVDAYVIMQCNRTDWDGEDEMHRLADVGKPNYGENAVTPVPGIRFRWEPERDTSLYGRFEYDVEDNTFALATLRFDHRLSPSFKWYLQLLHSDYRRWDFASCPYDVSMIGGDTMNLVNYSYVYAGFEHELCDAVAWSPYCRWDCLNGQLDSAGGWIDFRTDCLGFRLLIEYESEYTRIDGSQHDEDFSVGFYIYLRAFGADSANVFQ